MRNTKITVPIIHLSHKKWIKCFTAKFKESEINVYHEETLLSQGRNLKVLYINPFSTIPTQSDNISCRFSIIVPPPFCHLSP